MDLVNIGHFIAELRKEKNMTQQELGEILGVTNKTVSRWENGNYLPPVEMLQMMSSAFSVSINELITGERICDADYKQKAEENMISALRSSTFSLKDKTDFWKRKWMKEHTALIVISVLIVIAALGAGFISKHELLAGFSVVIAIAEYIYCYNKMMTYTEYHVYGGK
jgi:transcriptional regulator with XRE-family HTH domain